MRTLKIIGLILLLSIVGIDTAAAQTVEERFQQLTPKQQEQILQQMNNAASANGHTTAPAVVSTTKGVLEWVAKDGEAIGKGIAGIAREMGMVAVEFVNSDIGKISVFLLVWHLFGSQIVHVVVGILFILFSNYILMTKMRPLFGTPRVMPYKAKRFFGGVVDAEKVVYQLQGDSLLGLCMMYLAINLAGIIIIFTF